MENFTSSIAADIDDAYQVLQTGTYVLIALLVIAVLAFVWCVLEKIGCLCGYVKGYVKCCVKTICKCPCCSGYSKL
jgi:hypothetical protein